MRWSSEAMYQDRLVAAESVRERGLAELTEDVGDLTQPLLLIDTAGSLMHEAVETENTAKRGMGQLSESKYNEGEADLVMKVVEELSGLGIEDQSIGIISPYSAQVSLLKKMLKDMNKVLEVSTVDGFQGREKDVIIISMVRSNPQREIGFLSNERRMNVAVTRAKRLCCLIGDSGTVGKSPFLKTLMDYFRDNGVARTSFDYGQDVRIGYGVKKQAKTTKRDKPE